MTSNNIFQEKLKEINTEIKNDKLAYQFHNFEDVEFCCHNCLVSPVCFEFESCEKYKRFNDRENDLSDLRFFRVIIFTLRRMNIKCIREFIILTDYSKVHIVYEDDNNDCYYIGGATFFLFNLRNLHMLRILRTDLYYNKQNIDLLCNVIMESKRLILKDIIK